MCAMENPILRTGFRRAIAATHAPSQRQTLVCQRRWLATPTTESSAREPVRAARPIQFSKNRDQFSRQGGPPGRSSRGSNSGGYQAASDLLLKRIRVIPDSPSYFTAVPRFTDDYLNLTNLLRRHQLLPQLPAAEAPKVAWKTWEQYKTELDEPVKETRHSRLMGIVKRLNLIHPAVQPEEVTATLNRFKRTLQPFHNQAKPIIVDEHGRARATGRRKSSTASVYVVEGTGEVMVNGKSVTEYFGRLHDRESAVWALKSTERLDKYNVWAVTSGGGTTGQAESIMLAVAKGLIAHEPDLKPALRKSKFGTLLVCDLSDFLLTHFFHSWCCYAQPQACREKEGRQAQGSQDARLGQALSARTCARPLCYYVQNMYYIPNFPSIICKAPSSIGLLENVLFSSGIHRERILASACHCPRYFSCQGWVSAATINRSMRHRNSDLNSICQLESDLHSANNGERLIPRLEQARHVCSPCLRQRALS